MLGKPDLQLDNTVIESSTRFRQGSILRDIAVAFTTNPSYAITQLARDGAGDQNDVVRVALPLAIVTTQTCDLQNPKRMELRPFVTVARVFDASSEFDKGSLGHIIAGRIGDLRPITSPDIVAKDGIWVADLRLVGTIERGLLVGRQPIEGFNDEEGYLQFQRDLGKLQTRNAIDDRVLSLILKPLRAWLELNIEIADLIDEIRIRCLPSFLSARSVELYLLCNDAADPEEIQGRANELFTTLSRALPDDMQLLDMSATPISAFTRADEIGTEKLDLDDLSS